MNETDLSKLRELALLLDLAYMNRFNGDTSKYASAEGTIRLEFGNLGYRDRRNPAPSDAPEIESVVIYSSVFTANRISYSDTLDDAIAMVRRW